VTIEPSAPSAADRRRLEAGAACLFLLVLLLYGQVIGHGFVSYDDDRYVTDNSWVQGGLGLDGVTWAFTATHASNWHPLTWLSHMLDVELFGLDAAGHHATSVVLHATNALLLLLFLYGATGAFRRSLLVAALFAIHPLRVESVAWVAERKDVLAGTFWMLTLLAYTRYARRPGTGRYLVVAACLAVGLLAKPMLVTLPLVLLLIDVWPLSRLRSVGLRRLLLEKLPLLAIAGASSAVTFLVQQSGGAMQRSETWAIGQRVANALVSYVLYLWKTIWPSGLACFYPHPASLGAMPPLRVVVAASLLIILTGIAVRAFGRRPYVTVGWLWYLGALVPVIGIVQVGSQALADRYSYLPSIGLYLVLVWGVAEIAAVRPALQRLVALATAAVLVALTAVTWLQLSHWKDSRALFEHALRVTHGNYVAHNNLGGVLESDGELGRAATEFRAAIAIRADFAPPHNNLGLMLARQGDPTASVAHFEQAIRLDPGYADAYNNLGTVLQRQGNLRAALERFRRAIELDPGHAGAHNNLGVVLEAAGDLAGAEEHYETTLRLSPGFAEAHSNLGNVLLRRGDLPGARRHYENAVESWPDFAEGHNNLGYVLSRLGEAGAAVTHYRRALALRPGLYQAAGGLCWILATNHDPALRDGAEALGHGERCALATNRRDPTCLECLAAAHAELGRFEEAVRLQSEALALFAPGGRAAPLARRDSYRAGRPTRE